MNTVRLNWLLVVCLMALAVGPGLAYACSDIAIGDNQDIIISARTMDFNIDLKSDLKIVPRGQELTSSAPNGTPGLSWTTSTASSGSTPSTWTGTATE